MALQYHLLNQVNADADGWKIKVRVVRLWYQHVYMKPSERSSMDMVLMDEEGGKIAASVRTTLVSKFDDLLVEGGVYMLTKFCLADNNVRVRMANHACRISYSRHTKVKPLSNGFPLGRSMFSFTEFTNILEGEVGEHHAIDVIGVLTAYTDLTLTSHDGRSTNRVSFELQNPERRRLRCTLWSDHAEYFASLTPSFHGGAHVIVIIQLGKLRAWLGRPAVSNCYFGTKIIINEEHPEVASFRERVLGNPLIPVEPVKYIDFESLNIAYTLGEFAPGCDRILINDIRELREPAMVVIVGKAVCVQKDQLWYYIGCCKCYKSVEENALDKYTVEDCKGWQCQKCSETGQGFAYRYKIQIRVKDSSGSVSLCLFDRDASKLVGKSAYELYKSLPADAEEDIFPDEVNALAGRFYVFMVNIAQYNIDNNYHVFTVAKISDEAELLAEFQTEMEFVEENADHVGNVSAGNTPAASPSPSTVSLSGKRRSSSESPGSSSDASGVKKKLVSSSDASGVKKKLVLPKVEPK